MMDASKFASVINGRSISEKSNLLLNQEVPIGVRLAAARALCQDPSDLVRYDAIELLATEGNRSDWGRLRAGATDAYWPARCDAVDGLAAIFGERARPFLRDRYRSERNPTVRKYIGSALGDVGDADFLLSVATRERNPNALVGISDGLARLERGSWSDLFDLLRVGDLRVHHSVLSCTEAAFDQLHKTDLDALRIALTTQRPFELTAGLQLEYAAMLERLDQDPQ